ncbi:hypothetical protein [Idiomarina abyssalis]|uniref:hypothetical protein n=1 Tax=Idiomarina abyssalis TaxID=86102 RepID=UPI003A91F903
MKYQTKTGTRAPAVFPIPINCALLVGIPASEAVARVQAHNPLKQRTPSKALDQILTLFRTPQANLESVHITLAVIDGQLSSEADPFLHGDPESTAEWGLQQRVQALSQLLSATSSALNTLHRKAEEFQQLHQPIRPEQGLRFLNSLIKTHKHLEDILLPFVEGFDPTHLEEDTEALLEVHGAPALAALYLLAGTFRGAFLPLLGQFVKPTLTQLESSVLGESK